MSSVERDPLLPVTVLSQRALSSNVLLSRLRCERLGLDWLPGQHVELALPADPRISHYYSIASAPDPAHPGEFELAISRSASPELLAELETGRTLVISRPRGAFVWKAEPGPTLLVGIGTGIAPLRAILQAALAGRDERVSLFFGARTEGDLLFGDELEALARREPRFRFAPTLSQPSATWPGLRGRVQDHLQRHLSTAEPDRDKLRAFVCGNTPMVTDTVTLLVRLSVPSARISAESHGA